MTHTKPLLLSTPTSIFLKGDKKILSADKKK